jgi:hypothetical protein
MSRTPLTHGRAPVLRPSRGRATLPRQASPAIPATRRWPRVLGAVFLVVTLLGFLALSGKAFAPTPPPDITQRRLSDKLVPRSGALWGSSQVTSGLEHRLGREFAIAHFYNDWDDNFPTPAERARATNGSILFIDWTPQIFGASTTFSWASIAGGSHDAVIDAAADRINAFGQKLFFSFDHEPESGVGKLGTVAEFAAAYRHIHHRFAAKGVDNVVWVWNVMGYSGHYDMYANDLYPGDAYVDWIAWDPYNWYTCRGLAWTSFGDKVAQFYGWLQQHGFGDKPFMLAEYGTPERPGFSDAKAEWFAGIPAALQNRLPNVKALVYFQHPGRVPGCDWRVDTSPQSIAAFAAVGRHSYFNLVADSRPAAVGDNEVEQTVTPCFAAAYPRPGPVPSAVGVKEVVGFAGKACRPVLSAVSRACSALLGAGTVVDGADGRAAADGTRGT